MQSHGKFCREFEFRKTCPTPLAFICPLSFGKMVVRIINSSFRFLYFVLLLFCVCLFVCLFFVKTLPLFHLLVLILPRGWLPPLEIFPCHPKNQKESDLSHLGNLKYILCGHFDKKKIWGTPFRGRDKVNHLRWPVGGWLPPEKIKSRQFEKCIDCMVLKLAVYIRNVISFSYNQKLGEIPIFRTF